jgi:hypothetical protein
MVNWLVRDFFFPYGDQLCNMFPVFWLQGAAQRVLGICTYHHFPNVTLEHPNLSLVLCRETTTVLLFVRDYY